jgi:nucleoside triphosphatase
VEAAATRLIVVPIIRDQDDRVLLCKMPSNRGVFPGKWGLPGGGVETGETIKEALAREVLEELDVCIRDVKPLFFKDAMHLKTFPNGDKRNIYMVFLLFECRLDQSQTIRLNSEFCDYAWVEPGSLNSYDLNSETLDTFESLGFV